MDNLFVVLQIPQKRDAIVVVAAAVVGVVAWLQRVRCGVTQFPKLTTNYQTIVIRDGRITNIGKDGKVIIPDDAKQIPLNGKSLLPGWVMLHEHLFYGGSHKYPFTPKYANQVFIQQSVNYPRLFLAAGVTSARTVGSIKPYNDLSIKRAIDEGDLVGPDFDLTAPFLTGPTHSLEMYPLKNTKEVRETVRYWARLGFTSFKAYVS